MAETKPLRIELNTNGRASGQHATVKIDGVDFSQYVREISISVGVGLINSATIEFVNVDVSADVTKDGE
jgi:hypothetical protein